MKENNNKHELVFKLLVNEILVNPLKLSIDNQFF